MYVSLAVALEHICKSPAKFLAKKTVGERIQAMEQTASIEAMFLSRV